MFASPAASTAVPLKRVSEAGGEPVAISTPRSGESHFVPEFLPDGHHFFYAVTGGKDDVNGIYVGSLDGTPPRRLLPDQSLTAYVPARAIGHTGYLLFRRENSLMAQPFDSSRLQPTGEMFPLADPVGLSDNSNVQAAFSGSANGVIAFSAGSRGGDTELVWVGRDGAQLAIAAPSGVYDNFRLTLDEKKVAFDRLDADNRDI